MQRSTKGSSMLTQSGYKAWIKWCNSVAKPVWAFYRIWMQPKTSLTATHHLTLGHLAVSPTYRAVVVRYLLTRAPNPRHPILDLRKWWVITAEICPMSASHHTTKGRKVMMRMGAVLAVEAHTARRMLIRRANYLRKGRQSWTTCRRIAGASARQCNKVETKEPISTIAHLSIWLQIWV